jgi:uncharacterized protein (DUF433 family)
LASDRIDATASIAVTGIGALLVARPGYQDGRPWGTGITVHAIAAGHLAGLTAEDLCAQNPGLDPSLVHAALAYHFANREQIESGIERDREEGNALGRRFPAGLTTQNTGRL